MNKNQKLKTILTIITTVIVTGCSTKEISQQEADRRFLKKYNKPIKTKNKATKNKEDACIIVKKNPDWLKAMYRTQLVYNIPISTQLAFVKHESNFKRKARPLNKNRKSIFDKKYASTAYGYAQALDGTWKEYQTTFNNKRLKRTNYGHSVDFIGWYNNRHIKAGMNPNNISHLYLAYHEGLGGYRKKTYNKKPWLVNYSKAVEMSAQKYHRQLNLCKPEIKY